MSYNGSGTFNINTAGQPVVTGTVISSTAFNALTADLATGLSTAITKNGQTTITANIPWNSFKLTGLGVATTTGDALSYGQAATVTSLTATTGINGIVGNVTPAAATVTSLKATTGIITSDTTGNLSLQSNGTTVVAVTSAGAAVTGTLSTTAQALIGGASIGASANAFYGANGNGINYNRNTNTTAGKYWSSGPDNGNNYVVFNQSGTGVYVTDGGTTWTSLSDERLKDIIEPIADAASKVSTLRAVIGKYKTDDSTVRRSFLIAQDVQKVLPEAVDATNENRLGLQYTDTIPLLIAAIKELAARIAALESKQ